MILGIGASGRNVIRDSHGRLLCGVTEDMVQYILEKTGEPFEYVSLQGKVIYGCQGCVCCAKDNVCVLDDDWAEIRDKMIKTDAVIFGAPNYSGNINALGHAFLERTFSLRHKARVLAGKINAIVSVGTEEPSPVEDYILRIFRSNYMAEPVGILRVEGISHCYVCGYGENCAAGGVVARHGFLDQIRDYHRPSVSPSAYHRAEIIARRLGDIVRNKRTRNEKEF